MTKRQHNCCTFLLAGVLLAAEVLLCGGCPLVGLLGTPTRREEKIPAEFDLAQHQENTLLVLVDQPAWLNARANLRYYLTNYVGEQLVGKLDFPPGKLISYDRLSEFRSARGDFLSLSPPAIGQALGADVVLFVAVEGYELSSRDATNYHKGAMTAQCSLWQVSSAGKLWPRPEESRRVDVGFEVGPAGGAAAVERLTRAMAYCITRYFYDCPKDQFRISDDRTQTEWVNWK